ncbi:hypothetical protein FKO01_60540 [Mesorhizobium sp. B2-3-3]|nr:hypothetical protein FKO01_60540 [Mesorhizobium sp. B2-3-3]
MSIIPSAAPNDTSPAGLTPERELEIRTLEQAATPGPWESDGAEIYGTLGGVLMLDLWVGETLDIDNQERSNADAAFIATAREAVPELLAEVADLRARVAELEAQRDRRRARLVALQNDALSMRGSLSPNGEASKVPFELGETLTPAVDWLINRVAELEAALADATEPDVDGAGRTYQEYNPGSRDLRPGADAARRMIRDRQVAEGPRAPRQVAPVEAFAYDMDQALVDLSTEERRGADLVLQALRARATAADVPTAEDAS